MRTERKNRHAIPSAEEVKKRFLAAYDFNAQIGLYDNVRNNENFFIGNQWDGVQSNGLPTPTFNFLKHVVNFTIATITSDNVTIKATNMPGIGTVPKREMAKYCDIINNQYESIMERCRIVAKLREFLRNSAVDGDGCMYFYFDPTIENGQNVKGDIVAEVVQNTRIHFGNPNSRDVQNQPYIIVSRRMLVDDVKDLVEEYLEMGETEIPSSDDVKCDSDVFQNKFDALTDDKVTVLKYFFKRKETGTVWCMDVIEGGILRKAYDTEQKLYPFIWHSWDYIQDCYHGQAMITGLIPNQVFENKMFAMVGVSLLSQAFPKTIYDATRIKRWDGTVGAAVGVQGNVDNVAKVVEGASISPQVAQFMSLCMDTTKELQGATAAATGQGRADNTSAIIALQRAANTPHEMTKQSMYQCVEDMGLIWLDIMTARYGVRKVETKLVDGNTEPAPLGMQGIEDLEFMVDFDFSTLRNVIFNIKQDAGASSYWSEIASMQTLDNMYMNGKLNDIQYLSRVPNGYMVDKQELIDEKKRECGIAAGMQMQNVGTLASKETTSGEMEIPLGAGNSEMQRAIVAEGA